VALAPSRFPALAEPLLLQAFPLGRNLGEDARSLVAQADESAPQEKSSAQRRHIVDSQSVKSTGVGGEQRG
jgi:hypothetical protein